MYEISKELVELCAHKGIRIAVAESCTGGMLASAITDIAGSSMVFDRGFVTYSIESKADLLKVQRGLLRDCGAESSIVASEMVIGAIKNSNADIAVSITGIAGPTGGMEDKPVGIVYFATFACGVVECCSRQFSGDRKQIRAFATKFGLELLLKIAKDL